MRYAKRVFPLLALVALPVAVLAVDKGPDAAAPPNKAPDAAAASNMAPDADAPSTARSIEPEADRLLRQMTDYLASLQSFKVEAESVDELVTTSGRKIQLAADSIVYVERPNKLRSDRVGAENGLEYWYDGKTMSLYCKANNTYGTAPAPPTIDGAIDATREHYKIEAPGADLLFSQPYDVLTEQVKTGMFIGKETVGAVAVNHLAFEGDEVDWQIWIADGPEPLPLRYVITTKTMKEEPQFTVVLSNWQSHAKLEDAIFVFTPPPGAKAVDTFPIECGAGH